MRRYRILGLAFLAPAALVIALGCGKGGDKGGPPPSPPPGSPNSSSGPTGGAKTPIEAKQWTSLKGRVVFDGDPPKDDGKLKTQMGDHKDKARCLDEKAVKAGDTTDFTWRVSDKGGVENVVIWIEPPDGKYFKPNTPNEAVWQAKVKEGVKIDQPYCAFEPHVSTAFVSYFDGKDNKKTGQSIKIVNDATMDHNTNYAGHSIRNPGDNPTIKPGEQYDMTPKVKVDAKVPITLKCNIHQWMKGYLWLLDTPYYAVTDKDGNFEIKDLPADTDVNIVKWHEGLPKGWLEGGPEGTKIHLKAGEVNDLGEIKIKK